MKYMPRTGRQSKVLSVDNDLLDIDMPDFLTKARDIRADNIQMLSTKDEEKLEEEVDKFYEKFITQKEKSILTYLLFALYYI